MRKETIAAFIFFIVLAGCGQKVVEQAPYTEPDKKVDCNEVCDAGCVGIENNGKCRCVCDQQGGEGIRAQPADMNSTNIESIFEDSSSINPPTLPPL